MKGLIDSGSGMTLYRVLDRVFDRGEPGVLILRALEGDGMAEIRIGEGEVEEVTLGDLHGDAAMQAIQRQASWTYEYQETNTAAKEAAAAQLIRLSVPAGTAPSAELRANVPVSVESGRGGQAANGGTRPPGSPRSIPRLVLTSPVKVTGNVPLPETPSPENPAPAHLPEPEPEMEAIPAAPVPTRSVDSPVFSASVKPSPLPGIDVRAFSAGPAGFSPPGFPEDEQAFLQTDFSFLQQHARLIGQALGLSTLRALAYAEDQGQQAAAFRPQRGAVFHGVVADGPANVVQILGALPANPP